MEFAFIAGQQSLRLLPPDPALCTALAHALNASHVAHAEFLPWARPHTSEAQALEFLQQSQDAFSSETGERRWFIVTDDGQAVLGCIGLKPRRRNRYVVGYWANTEHSGKGYMRAALSRLLGGFPDAAFYLSASSANARSQRLAESVGFELIRVHPAARNSAQHGVQDTLAYRLNTKRQAKKSPRESAGEP
ncbi:GNAT family N-acetyltransferase [Pseudomonas sp. COR58]|uniref:GNAT family N-acetyltransferase n=1 Tax=Pseudomonas ekonensis TaxID=2842353 RepID=A0ABS6PIX7_9PSED|nr:GNAT family N-acetyltransferase [Pseudomonas ekonensis]MBV4460423.1 GNAT family N-acetyltransferase [Pseudomonas ekonensis]